MMKEIRKGKSFHYRFCGLIVLMIDDLGPTTTNFDNAKTEDIELFPVKFLL
jgi:hypothetical protein